MSYAHLIEKAFKCDELTKEVTELKEENKATKEVVQRQAELISHLIGRLGNQDLSAIRNEFQAELNPQAKDVE